MEASYVDQSRVVAYFQGQDLPKDKSFRIPKATSRSNAERIYAQAQEPSAKNQAITIPKASSRSNSGSFDSTFTNRQIAKKILSELNHFFPHKDGTVSKVEPTLEACLRGFQLINDNSEKIKIIHKDSEEHCWVADKHDSKSVDSYSSVDDFEDVDLNANPNIKDLKKEKILIISRSALEALRNFKDHLEEKERKEKEKLIFVNGNGIALINGGLSRKNSNTALPKKPAPIEKSHLINEEPVSQPDQNDGICDGCVIS